MKNTQSNFLSIICSLLVLILAACHNGSTTQTKIAVSGIEINQQIKEADEIEAIVAPYRDSLETIMDEVIGFAAHDLTTKGKYESTLGTFVTRLCLEQSEAIFEQEVDVAIMNHHGGLRAPINKGNITLGEVFQVMPFENEMLLLEVPGDVLKDVIDHISESGRSMIWPVSFTVTDAGAEDVMVNGKAIDKDKIYILAISDYLANGGGGFKMLKTVKRLELDPVKVRFMIEKEVRERTARGEYVQAEIQQAVIFD